MGKAKYRKLVDLYVRGTEKVLRDGTPVWVQILNPFERDGVRSEAQIARARVVMAMKEHGSDEQLRVKAAFYAEGREDAVSQLVEVDLSKGLGKLIDGVRNDPEWTEKIAILDRGLDDSATVATDPEQTLMTTIEVEYLDEIGKRAETEKKFLADKYNGLDEKSLWEAYLGSWLDRQGDQAAVTSYKLGMIAAGIRTCEGVDTDAGWQHDACAGHRERVWDTVEEVRDLPEGLQEELIDAIEALELTEREAKNSDRQMSSSGSSQLPNEEEGSTPSTPDVTPSKPRGTSSAPSPMLSPSSDGSNSPTPTSPPSPSGSTATLSPTTSPG